MRDFDWQILVTLHKTNSITKTAELLYISQPALTKRIQIIEDELGIPLIMRSRRGSEFTAEGERVARKAEAVVAAIQEIKNDMVARNKGARGILRLGVPYSYVRYVLPALLARYSSRSEGVEIDIVTALSDELMRRVQDDTLDLTFARYGAHDSFLERSLVSEDPVYAVYNRPFEISELARLPYVEFAKNPVIMSAIQRWWNENFSEPWNVRFKVPTGDCCVAMVKHGLGFGIFPDPKYFRHEKGMYAIPLEFADGTKFTRPTWLLYKRSSMKNPVVADFIDFVQSIDVNDLADGMEERNDSGDQTGER